MTQSPTKAAFEHVFGAFKGHQTLQTIALGLELGLFEVLRAEPMTAQALAARLWLHPPYVRVWCEVTVAFGVLDVNESGEFSLASGMETVLLDSDHPRYLGGFARGFLTFLADDFALYPAAFKDGQVRPFAAHGEAFSAWVSTLTHPMQRLVAGKVLPEHFGAALDQGVQLLDVGSGAGQLIFKLAALYPNCQFTGIDGDPHGVALANRAAASAGFGDRVRFVQVYGEAMTFENAFDLALMFEVLHEIPVDARVGVMNAVHRALKPGGKLFILDETWADNLQALRDPAYAMSVLVQFSELVWGNVVYTETEQSRLLTEAGFVNIQRSDLGGTFTILVAEKQKALS